MFAATMTPLINQDGETVGRVLVARDITAQTRLETEREALRGRLAQSEKLASLGQFVAGIAHEMNNPLQGILGHLELLIETSEAARPVRPKLRRIYQEGDRAAKIVRNLLVFTGSRRMTRQRLRIERVISRALASRSAARRRGASRSSRHQEDVPEIAGDPLLLQQALLNILINAEHAIAATSGAGADRDVRRGVGRRRDGPAHGARYRARHPGGGAAAHLRSVLHDQGGRPGNGPRAGDYLRDHPGARRHDPRRQSAGGRRRVRHRASRGRERYGSKGPKGKSDAKRAKA